MEEDQNETERVSHPVHEDRNPEIPPAQQVSGYRNERQDSNINHAWQTLVQVPQPK